MISFFILLNSYVYTTENLEKSHQPVANENVSTQEYSLDDDLLSRIWSREDPQSQITILQDSDLQYYERIFYSNAELAHFQSYYNPLYWIKTIKFEGISDPSNDIISCYYYYICDFIQAVEEFYGTGEIFGVKIKEYKYKIVSHYSLFKFKANNYKFLIMKSFVLIDLILDNISKLTSQTNLTKEINQNLILIKNTIFFLDEGLSYRAKYLTGLCAELLKNDLHFFLNEMPLEEFINKIVAEKGKQYILLGEVCFQNLCDHLRDTIQDIYIAIENLQ